MEIKYKPTKPKKEKPFKAPKAEKAAKPMSFGSAQSVKLDKPKKVKEPKPAKAPKPEKAISFTPTKVEKATDFKASGKLPKSVNTKVLAVGLSVVAVIFCVGAIIFFNQTGFGEESPVVKPETLTITDLPAKTEYYVGEVAVFSDMKLKVTLTNGVSVNLVAGDCEITGFDSSAPTEKQTITVKYKDLTATFDIAVKGSQSNADPVGDFNGLSFKTLPKTEYKVGERLSVEGGVLLRHYDDGTTVEMPLENQYVKNFDSLTPGVRTIIVQYIDDGFLAETTYTITVTE